MKTLRLLSTSLALALFGSVLTARGAAPTATTLNASNIIPGGATLHGLVNPGSASTRVLFQWGLTTNYGSVTSTQTLTGSSTQPVSRTLSNLVSLTTYHFRVVASNSSGLRFGTNQSFVSAALPPPSAVTDNPSQVGGTSVLLHGTVNPNGFPAAAWFEWGTNAGYGNTTATQQLAGGNSPSPLAQPAGPLLQNTTYHYRLRALGGGGASDGADVVFLTGAAAQPLALPASSITLTSAVLNGQVHPGRLETSARFEWGATTNYGQTTAWQAAGAVNGIVPLAQALSGLAPLTVWHYRLVVSNELGVVPSGDQVFETRVPPSVVTLPASNILPSGALLSASINPNGIATTAAYEWGPTLAYGRHTPPAALGDGTNEVGLPATLTGLLPGLTWHYRAVATNSVGTTLGGKQTFTTACPPGLSTATVSNCTEADLLAAMANASEVTFACDGIITLTRPVQVGCALKLDAGGRSVVLSGGNSNRLFEVLPGANLELVGLTLANGVTSGEGGGILITEARLSVRSCTFKTCFADGFGGAISALHSQISLSECTFVSNAVPVGSRGGAMRVLGGVANLTNSQFIFNQAGSGGAIWLSGGTNLTTVQQTFFATNATLYSGGALIMDNGVLSLGRCTFLGNYVYATINAGSPHAYGGAIVMTTGTAQINDCQFKLNQARGVDIYLRSSGTHGFGGALVFQGGSLALTRSTFQQNSAVGGDGGFPFSPFPELPGGATGGAIYHSAGDLRATNCTFTANYAQGGGMFPGFYVIGYGQSFGGAIGTWGGSLVLASCTIASNLAMNPQVNQSQGGGLFTTHASNFVVHTVLAGNAVNSVASSNWFGTIPVDLGRNLSSDATPAWTSGSSLNNADARLLPLASNGGPTPTMALRVGSPALNFADPATVPATDQRGVARPQGAGPDTGAWEGAGGPVLLGIRRENATTNLLTWLSDTGLTYRVEGANVLNSWSTLATGLPGTGGPVQYRTTNSGHRYYRVATEP